SPKEEVLQNLYWVARDPKVNPLRVKSDHCKGGVCKCDENIRDTTMTSFVWWVVDAAYKGNLSDPCSSFKPLETVIKALDARCVEACIKKERQEMRRDFNDLVCLFL